MGGEVIGEMLVSAARPVDDLHRSLQALDCLAVSNPGMLCKLYSFILIRHCIPAAPHALGTVAPSQCPSLESVL